LNRQDYLRADYIFIMAWITDRVSFLFIVQSYPNGQPWIELEPPDGKSLPGSGNSFLG
jgi:hypothetical protein